MTHPKSLAEIAAQLQGYDPQALPAQEVLNFLAQLVNVVHDTEDVPIFEALNRVIASDVISPIDVPPHDNSAMDGFAFNGSEIGRAHV